MRNRCFPDGDRRAHKTRGLRTAFYYVRNQLFYSGGVHDFFSRNVRFVSVLLYVVGRSPSILARV